MVDEKTITDEEFKKIEEEVSRKQAEALKVKAGEQAKEIEEKVRKEMEAKLEADKLKEQLEKQAKEIEALRTEQETRTKALEDAFKKQLEDALAQKKGVAKNESPFEQKPGMIKAPDGTMIDVDNLDLKQVEEDSRKAFIQHFGIKDPDFGKPQWQRQ